MITNELDKYSQDLLDAMKDKAKKEAFLALSQAKDIISRRESSPIFPYFKGSVPSGNFAIVAGEVDVTTIMDIGGTLVCL